MPTPGTTAGLKQDRLCELQCCPHHVLARCRRIVLADHSKIGVQGRISFAPLSDIDLLITNVSANTTRNTRTTRPSPRSLGRA